MVIIEAMPLSVTVTFMSMYMCASLLLVLWCLFCFVVVAVATREGGLYDDLVAQEEADDLPAGTEPKIVQRARRRSITFQTPLERGSRKADGLKVDMWSRSYYGYVVVTINLLSVLYVITYSADAGDSFK
jgi:hypothetical protein